MSFWIDVVIICIVIFCGWRGYKNGLIRGVFGIVSLIAALLIANIAAHAYSKEATSVIMPFASGIIDSTVNDDEIDLTYQSIAHDHGIDDEVFGEAYMVLREIGMPEAASVAIAKQVMEEQDTFTMVYDFIDSLAEKLTNSLSYVAVFGIAFLVLAIIFTIIGNLFGFVFSLPGLKLVDTISGSLFGLVKGVLIVLTIALIIRYFGLLAGDVLEETTLLEYLVNNNFIANMFNL